MKAAKKQAKAAGDAVKVAAGAAATLVKTAVKEGQKSASKLSGSKEFKNVRSTSKKAADATRKVEHSQLNFLEDFSRLAQEAGLPLDNDFPRLRLLKATRNFAEGSPRCVMPCCSPPRD